jgi:hypothetical protein
MLSLPRSANFAVSEVKSEFGAVFFERCIHRYKNFSDSMNIRISGYLSYLLIVGKKPRMISEP